MLNPWFKHCGSQLNEVHLSHLFSPQGISLLGLWDTQEHLSTVLGGHFKEWDHQPKAQNWKMGKNRTTKGYFKKSVKAKIRRHSIYLAWPHPDHVYRVTQTFWHPMYVCERLWNCLKYWLGSYKYILVSKDLHIGKPWITKIECVNSLIQ